MTAVDPTTPNEQVAAERRRAARDACRASLVEGVPLTGAELGRRFGLSPRWGRDRVSEAHVEAAARANGGGAETGHGPETHARGRDEPRRETGPKDRQANVAERGAESAWRSSNGAAPRSDRRAGSERPPGDEAPAEATHAVRGITTLAVLAVAVVAAVASYDHQRALAELAGEGWRAWLLPVSVDGLVVAASMSMLVRRRAGLPAGSLAWTSLLAGIGASLAANVAAAAPRRSGDLSPPGRPSPYWSPGSC